jgi:hypothetical protein
MIFIIVVQKSVSGLDNSPTSRHVEMLGCGLTTHGLVVQQVRWWQRAAISGLVVQLVRVVEFGSLRINIVCKNSVMDTASAVI